MLFQVFHFPLQSDFGSFTLSSLDEKRMYKEALFIKIEENGGNKGVIDLFFEHKGRYYFIDWKSNYLTAYDQISMKEEMTEYAYYEQAHMYTQALSHYVTLFDNRSFEQLFGGFFYIFLRGPGVVYGR
jgi:exodeoxyribonuclease V beta subunit